LPVIPILSNKPKEQLSQCMCPSTSSAKGYQTYVDLIDEADETVDSPTCNDSPLSIFEAATLTTSDSEET
jgi:hypothetical protein